MRSISYGQAADAPIQIWSGTVTSGTWGNAFGNGNATGYGYSSRDNAGSISNPNFTHRGTNYTIEGFGLSRIGNITNKYVLTIRPGFPSCDKQRLRFDGLVFRLADAGVGGTSYGAVTYIWNIRTHEVWPAGHQFTLRLVLDPTAPEAPIVAAINEGNQVRLSWTTPCDGGIDITGHEYREKVGNGSFGSWTPIPNSAAGEVNAASYTVTGLNNPSEYTFEVRAVNALGEGAISAEAIVSNLPAVPLSDRTPQVRDGIVAAVPDVSDYRNVTEAHLAAITTLRLGNQNITSLKPGDFSGLTALTRLNLPGNQLSSLPNGIFEGLTSLTHLLLGGNSVDPLPLTVSLEKVAEGQFKAVAPTGAPFEMVLPLIVTNGSIGTTNILIPKGSVESTPLIVIRTPGTADAVTVDLGTLPGLPTNHYGYALVKSADLPLEVISGTTGGQASTFSLSLDANSAAGDQSATSITVSPDQVVSIQVFGSSIQNARGFGLHFEYDARQVVYEGFDVGSVLPGSSQVLAEHGTNPTSVTIGIASFGSQPTVSSGLVGTIRFRTTTEFSGTAVQLVRAELSRGGQSETVDADCARRVGSFYCAASFYCTVSRL